MSMVRTLCSYSQLLVRCCFCRAGSNDLFLSPDYAVMRDDEGLYTYAKLSDDGKLVPSKAQVGHLHSTTEDLPIKGLRPKAANDGNASGKSKNRSGCAKESGCEGRTFTTPSSSGSLRGIIPDQNRRRTATVGTLKNLVVLVRFSDHNRRVLPSKNEINILMNSEEADPKYSPTGSLKMVYWENSYGLLTIDSQVTDWIRVSKPESYYAAGESGVGTRRLFQEALVEVLNKLEAQGFDFSSFDQDKDTHIDSIAFMTSGYGAEWGGSECRGLHLHVLFDTCRLRNFNLVVFALFIAPRRRFRESDLESPMEH